MASISHNKANGTKSIQFSYPKNGTRRILALGKCTEKQAESIKRKIEALVFSKTAGTIPESAVAEWLASTEPRIRERLEAWGLIEPMALTVEQAESSHPASVDVLEFIDKYIENRKDTSERTRLNYNQARNFLAKFMKECLSPSRTVKTFTKGDAKQFRNWLFVQRNFKRNTDQHSENYVRTQCKNLKLFFGAAVDSRLIDENPFKDKSIPCKVQPVPGRMCFVSSDDVQKMLKQCPDIEWQIVLALARWGGLRIPSEIVGLKWEHINWNWSPFPTITILQPKLKHQGKGQRVAPLFHQLVPILTEAKKAANADEVYVLPRLRGEAKNLRTTLNKIATRAGVAPWEKPFQNLRSTRATELEKEFGLKATSEWLGHDIQISLAHYQQIRAEDLKAATTPPDGAM